ncbi:MAG: phenylacetate--CoA ligase family protein, partial [Desulfosalsimonadaceae bacterium]|nr:phenylacetate--CoA ligase family protein [Desulfosalsimonadaceae bacterium]
IRFKTGDRARILRETCSCGRQLRRIEWTGERVDDLLNIDGVKIHTRQMQLAIESLLGFSSNASTFHVRKTDGRQYIEVFIPVNDTIFSDEIKELEALIHRAETNLLENIGIPVVIRLKENRTD